MDLLQHILRDPLTYIVLFTVWIGRMYIERRISAGVDQRFSERLEAYKQSLTVLTEEAKFDFQRKLVGFNLFTQKKHEAATKVWEGVRVAHGYISGLWGLRNDYTFEEFNSADITAHMEEQGVPKGKQEEVLPLWESDRAGALRILRPYLRMLRINNADRKFQEAKNTIYFNELYFSDDVILTLDLFVREGSEWITHAQFPAEVGDPWRPDRAALDAALEKVHDSLRAEISTASSLPRRGSPADPGHHPSVTRSSQ